jgi:hypothetical protein
MKLITLLTDFSEKDGYPAVMKGVILGFAPDAQIIDLSHAIPPQYIRQAALLLGRSAPYFPSGAAHLCVVDPGVGTERRGIIARLGSRFFIGPDNGLMTLLYRQTMQKQTDIEIFTLENPAYRLAPVSRTFHGRDIFAPAAAHLVNGVSLSAFGRPVNDPVLLDLPLPKKTVDGWLGEVVSIDAFGNLACSLDAAHIAHPETAQIRIKDRTINRLIRTFADRKPGELCALLDSFGQLSVCVVNGSAAKVLGAGAGEPVRLIE